MMEKGIKKDGKRGKKRWYEEERKRIMSSTRSTADGCVYNVAAATLGVGTPLRNHRLPHNCIIIYLKAYEYMYDHEYVCT